MDKNSSFVVQDDPKSPAAEAFRTLRTNIHYAAYDSEIRKILVTSATPADGKSTVAMNLAAAMAQAGRNCVLVDCDLRRPVQHKQFRIANRKGLVNLLLGDATLEEVCQHTDVPGLRVIPSGPVPPNPAELVGSARMDDVLSAMLADTDVVIMDCPPVMAVTDALALATKSDGVLLVVSAGSTPRHLAMNAKNAIAGVGARLLGVVLNRVDYRSSYGYYSYYTYYNYYGSGDNS